MQPRRVRLQGLALTVPEPKMTARAADLLLDLDEGRLAAMLALVGPACERHLLSSLIGDLKAARTGLLQAAEQGDPARLRDQTHVLASLAGTFGAVSLNRAAQDLEAHSLSAAPGLESRRVIHLTDSLITELTSRLAGTLP